MTYIPQIPIRDLVDVEFEGVEYGIIHAERGFTAVTQERLNNICKDGNINQNKHLIIFKTTSGILKVNATVWMVGKKYILLKENLYIPIESIIEIQ